MGLHRGGIQDFINLHMIIKWLKFLSQTKFNFGAVCLWWTHTCTMHKKSTTVYNAKNRYCQSQNL